MTKVTATTLIAPTETTPFASRDHGLTVGGGM